MPSRMDTSSIDTGSSASSTRGRTASARAIATRCRCPPDSSCGYLSQESLGRRERHPLEQAGQRLIQAARVPSPCTLSGRVRW